MIQHLETLIRFFLISFKSGDDDPTRNYFDEDYMP